MFNVLRFTEEDTRKRNRWAEWNKSRNVLGRCEKCGLNVFLNEDHRMFETAIYHMSCAKCQEKSCGRVVEKLFFFQDKLYCDKHIEKAKTHHKEEQERKKRVAERKRERELKRASENSRASDWEKITDPETQQDYWQVFQRQAKEFKIDGAFEFAHVLFIFRIR